MTPGLQHRVAHGGLAIVLLAPAGADARPRLLLGRVLPGLHGGRGRPRVAGAARPCHLRAHTVRGLEPRVERRRHRPDRVLRVDPRVGIVVGVVVPRGTGIRPLAALCGNPRRNGHRGAVGAVRPCHGLWPGRRERRGEHRGRCDMAAAGRVPGGAGLQPRAARMADELLERDGPDRRARPGVDGEPDVKRDRARVGARPGCRDDSVRRGDPGLHRVPRCRRGEHPRGPDRHRHDPLPGHPGRHRDARPDHRGDRRRRAGRQRAQHRHAERATRSATATGSQSCWSSWP